MAKRKLKCEKQLISLIIGLGLGVIINVPEIQDTYQQFKIITTQENMINSGNEKLLDLIRTVDTQVSKEAEEAIKKINTYSINNRYLSNLNITANSLVYLLGYERPETEHKYNHLYDSKNDDIKWDEAEECIIKNSQNAVKEDSDLIETSLEELKEQIRLLKEEYYQLKEDFPDYQTEDLACKLEYYAIVKSKVDDGNVVATTGSETITYLPSYEDLIDIAKTDANYHENFHLCTRDCIDQEGTDNLELYIPVFIKEIYAAQYAAEVNDFFILSYDTYENALDLIQACLALDENYQIDNLLKDLVYNSSEDFFKEFPVFAENEKSGFLDTIKALKGLDLLLDSSKKELYPDLNYTKKAQEEIKNSVYEHFFKMYLSNLIMLNEKEEMTIEDNVVFLRLYQYLVDAIKIDSTNVEQDSSDMLSKSKIEPNLGQIGLSTKEMTERLKEITLTDYQDTFINYLAQKYQEDPNVLEEQILSTEVSSEDYQFPSFLGEEKQAFYSYLKKQSEKNTFQKPRTLIKQK